MWNKTPSWLCLLNPHAPGFSRESYSKGRMSKEMVEWQQVSQGKKFQTRNVYYGLITQEQQVSWYKLFYYNLARPRVKFITWIIQKSKKIHWQARYFWSIWEYCKWYTHSTGDNIYTCLQVMDETQTQAACI